MDLKSRGHIFSYKLTGLIVWLTQGRWQIVPTRTVDALYTEIRQLEKTLANAPTRPMGNARKSKPVEAVTEQQKIVDLAG